MYAALWEAYRVEYQMSSGGPGSGLFKSTDGGETGRRSRATPACRQASIGKIGVAVSGADSNRVYALVENENGGLFSSDDAGATWKLVNDGRATSASARSTTRTSPPIRSNKDIVYVLNIGAFRSTRRRQDDDEHRPARTATHHDLWIDPDDPQHIVHGNDGGGAVSFNARRTQRTWIGAGLSDRAVLSRDHDHARAVSRLRRAAGQQHVCVPSDTDARRRTAAVAAADAAARRSYSVGGGEPGYIAPDPKDPDVFFAGGNNGSFLTRLNRRTGELREVSPYPRLFSGETVERARRALAVDLPDHLLAGRSERALHLVAARVEDDQRRRRRGTGSAATSRVTIRRRWAIRAARSRTT